MFRVFSRCWSTQPGESKISAISRYLSMACCFLRVNHPGGTAENQALRHQAPQLPTSTGWTIIPIYPLINPMKKTYGKNFLISILHPFQNCWPPGNKQRTRILPFATTHWDTIDPSPSAPQHCIEQPKHNLSFRFLIFFCRTVTTPTNLHIFLTLGLQQRVSNIFQYCCFLWEMYISSRNMLSYQQVYWDMSGVRTVETCWPSEDWTCATTNWQWNEMTFFYETWLKPLSLYFPSHFLFSCLPGQFCPWEFRNKRVIYQNWIELGDSVNFLSLSRRNFWRLLNPLVENWSKTIKVLLLKSHRVHLHPPAFEQNAASDILAVSTSAGGILHLVLQGPQQSYERYPEVLDILLCCELSIAWVFEFQYLFPTPAGSPCCVYQCEIAWLLDSPTPRENPDAHVRTYNSISYPNDHRSGHYCVQPQQRAHSWICQYMRICH